MRLFRTKTYQKKILKLLTEAEVVSVEHEIASDPEKWPVIGGTGGVRKARASRGNSGKSGGVRIMYYFRVIKSSIYFVDIYAKNEKENIDARDKKALCQLVEEIKKAEV